MNEPVRLAKRLAALLTCSRSEAEQYIEGGWVRVDGQIVEEPHFRVLHEKIELDPHATLMAQPPVTLLLHKPAGHAEPQQLLDASTHWPADPDRQRALKRHFRHLRPAMPLEAAASGLMVFTQDGRVARKLTQDAHLVEVEVMVEVEGEIGPEKLHHLQHGPAGEAVSHYKVSVSSSGKGRSTLRFAVKGSVPGLIPDVCRRAGLQLLAMKRIRIGRVAMTRLPAGQWRYLQPGERF